MTLIDNNEVKKIRRIFTKIRSIVFPTHECLEDRKKDASIGWNSSFFLDISRIYTHKCIFWKGRERIKGLIRKDVSISKKKDSRTAFSISCKIPARLKKFPCNLERDKCLSGSSRKREEDPISSICKSIYSIIDCIFLIISSKSGTSNIFKRNCLKLLFPFTRFKIDTGVKFFGSRECIHQSFLPCLHIDLIDFSSVRGIGVFYLKFFCV